MDKKKKWLPLQEFCFFLHVFVLFCFLHFIFFLTFVTVVGIYNAMVFRINTVAQFTVFSTLTIQIFDDDEVHVYNTIPKRLYDEVTELA